MTEDDLKKAAWHFEYCDGEAWGYGPKLIAEVRRLQALLGEAQFSGVCDRCPWCHGDAAWVNGRDERGGGHKDDCPAFGVAHV